jgi:hypothetical protein
MSSCENIDHALLISSSSSAVRSFSFASFERRFVDALGLASAAGFDFAADLRGGILQIQRLSLVQVMNVREPLHVVQVLSLNGTTKTRPRCLLKLKARDFVSMTPQNKCLCGLRATFAAFTSATRLIFQNLSLSESQLRPNMQ